MTPHGGRQFLRRALPDTNKFCADALEQIRIAAPKHAILLNNFLATPGAHLDLLSVSLVFMVVPLFSFFLVCLSFHRGTAGNPARYNTERWRTSLKSLKGAFPGENAALPPKAFQGQRSAPILPPVEDSRLNHHSS
jgi:hypothetical protein